MSVGFLGLILLIGVPVLLIIIGLFAVIISLIFRGGRASREKQLRLEESKMIQEIHTGLNRMEERAEALETILLDRAERRDHAKAERD